MNSAMNKILFKETQQFRQWWLIILVLAVTVVVIYSFYDLWERESRQIPGGEIDATAVASYMFLCLILGLILWEFLVAKLEVSIDKKGIHYRFFPFPSSFREKVISKAEIQRYEIRKYNALRDYGGWGVRRGYGRKWGPGYIVSGNIGLQLYLTNGKKVLFGTQKPQAIIYAMDEIIKQ